MDLGRAVSGVHGFFGSSEHFRAMAGKHLQLFDSQLAHPRPLASIVRCFQLSTDVPEAYDERQLSCADA